MAMFNGKLLVYQRVYIIIERYQNPGSPGHSQPLPLPQFWTSQVMMRGVSAPLSLSLLPSPSLWLWPSLLDDSCYAWSSTNEATLMAGWLMCLSFMVNPIKIDDVFRLIWGIRIVGNLNIGLPRPSILNLTQVSPWLWSKGPGPDRYHKCYRS